MTDTRTVELMRKIKEIEAVRPENDKLAVRLGKSTRHMMRLRLERKFLLEKLEQLHPTDFATATASLDELLSLESSDEKIDVAAEIEEADGGDLGPNKKKARVSSTAAEAGSSSIKKAENPTDAKIAKSPLPVTTDIPLTTEQTA